jgi:SAM-dependent methyltransferase
VKPKPGHLTEEWASQWEAPEMAAAYPNRPSYPPGVFDALLELMPDGGRVLDIGCGTGQIARPLAERDVEVDGVDRSQPMIELGRAAPGGDKVHWILGRAEDAPLHPPYALTTAGESIHWMDWERVFPRLRALAPRLALVFRNEEPMPWHAGLSDIIPRYSTNRGFRRYDMVEELVSRGLFTLKGECLTDVHEVEQGIDECVECIHSRNGFSRARMDPDAAADFDERMRALVEPHAVNGRVRVRLRGVVKWGRAG